MAFSCRKLDWLIRLAKQHALLFGQDLNALKCMFMNINNQLSTYLSNFVCTVCLEFSESIQFKWL